MPDYIQTILAFGTFALLAITAHQLWRIAEALEERNDEWRDDE